MGSSLWVIGVTNQLQVIHDQTAFEKWMNVKEIYMKQEVFDVICIIYMVNSNNRHRHLELLQANTKW